MNCSVCRPKKYDQGPAFRTFNQTFESSFESERVGTRENQGRNEFSRVGTSSEKAQKTRSDPNF